MSEVAVGEVVFKLSHCSHRYKQREQRQYYLFYDTHSGDKRSECRKVSPHPAVPEPERAAAVFLDLYRHVPVEDL